MDFTQQPFQLGQNLTHEELRTAFQRISGRPIPAGANLREAAATLARNAPERFTFEVNRCRGFAFELEELCAVRS